MEGPMLDEPLRKRVVEKDRELIASHFEFNQVCRAWVRSLRRVVDGPAGM